MKLSLKVGNGNKVKEGEYKTKIEERSNDGNW
jgi:hypothetical protein